MSFQVSPARLTVLTPGLTYRAGSGRGTAREVISKLIPGVGNRGGIRPAKCGDRITLIILTLTSSEEAWPDHLDRARAMLTYFGDNIDRGRSEGKGLRSQGNVLLRDAFKLAQRERRTLCPIFLAFERPAEAELGWDTGFLGLFVPGTPFLPPAEWLTVRSIGDSPDPQALNYQARFTLLDTGDIDLDWVAGVAGGRPWMEGRRPDALAKWAETGQHAIAL